MASILAGLIKTLLARAARDASEHSGSGVSSSSFASDPEQDDDEAMDEEEEEGGPQDVW